MDIDANIVTKTTETILGKNTSSIPITEIAAAVKSPKRVVGIHFCSPAHRMQVVEIVKGLLTYGGDGHSGPGFCGISREGASHGQP